MGLPGRPRDRSERVRWFKGMGRGEEIQLTHEIHRPETRNSAVHVLQFGVHPRLFAIKVCLRHTQITHSRSHLANLGFELPLREDCGKHGTVESGPRVPAVRVLGHKFLGGSHRQIAGGCRDVYMFNQMRQSALARRIVVLTDFVENDYRYVFGCTCREEQ